MPEIIVDQILEEKDGLDSGIVLSMTHAGGWDSPEVSREVYLKIIGYASLVVNGLVYQKYPEYVGKKCKIRLVCYQYPPEAVLADLDVINNGLRKRNSGLEIRVIAIGDQVCGARGRVRRGSGFMGVRAWFRKLLRRE